MGENQIKIGLADDQRLFLKSLSALINSFGSYEVVIEASNGEELLHKISNGDKRPDILLIDVNMPVMDGPFTTRAIARKFPDLRMAALSVRDDDTTILSMIKAGCCSYLLKDIHPVELDKALQEIYRYGYYNADTSNINFRRLLLHEKQLANNIFSDNEILFLKLASSDLTYRQIASEMHKSERTIDGYRDSLFQKLNVQSRVGMVLEGLRRKLVSFEALV